MTRIVTQTRYGLPNSQQLYPNDPLLAHRRHRMLKHPMLDQINSNGPTAAALRRISWPDSIALMLCKEAIHFSQRLFQIKLHFAMALKILTLQDILRHLPRNVLSYLNSNVRVENGICFAPRCAKATLSLLLVHSTDWVKSNIRWNCPECHKLKNHICRRVKKLEELQQEHAVRESKPCPVSSKLKKFVAETLQNAFQSYPNRQDAIGTLKQRNTETSITRMHCLLLNS